MADRLLWEDLEERPNPRTHPTALSAFTYRRAHALSANLVAKALSRSRAAGEPRAVRLLNADMKVHRHVLSKKE